MRTSLMKTWFLASALVAASAATGLAQDAPDPEAHMLACQVKAHLDEVGRDVARHATEVHGGMGFTELLGLPFWFKRIAANRQLLGGPERCREDAVARFHPNAMVDGYEAIYRGILEEL